MKHKITLQNTLYRPLLIGGLLFCLTLSSASAAGFSPSRSYSEAHFTDVPQDWSLPYISACYEMGLMSGRGQGLFAPDGQVSLAEGITVAARVHSLRQGGEGEFPLGDPWYASAVEYAQINGIMALGDIGDYSLPASRAQLADLLARALPLEDYSPINEVASLPDVTQDHPYAESIFRLYRAGILTGSDVYGTFSPEAAITRGEMAAILCRLVQPERRMTLALQLSPVKNALPNGGVLALDAVSFQQALDSGKPMMVLFYATWCTPCQVLAPTIEELAAQYQGHDLLIGKVDIDQQPGLTRQYAISSYPTVLFFRDGQELERFVGSMPLEDYTAFLNRTL